MMPITRLIRMRSKLLRALSSVERKIARLAVQEGYSGYYKVDFEGLVECLEEVGEDPYP